MTEGDFERYEQYAEQFDPLRTDRRLHRQRQGEPRRAGDREHRATIREIADPAGLEAGFETTYVPSLFEQSWLPASLRPFYEQELISDVLALIKGGKEAHVYRCRAGQAAPDTGSPFLAAKVYRPRKFRNLRNDRPYREGRALLSEEGTPIRKNDHRLMRAVGKKTALGVQVEHTSWLMYEYTTLQRLAQAGGAVPAPVAAAENAILMGYLGDERRAAPTLHETRLAPQEAGPLLAEVLHNIELLLHLGLVHGDLSAFNILYWQGRIALIDFPQVVQSRSNSNARAILARDLERVCDYFAAQGVPCAAEAFLNGLWGRYGPSPVEQQADLSRWMDEEDESIEFEETPLDQSHVW